MRTHPKDNPPTPAPTAQVPAPETKIEKFNKFVDTASKIKVVGQQMGDVVLLGFAWKSVELDDKVAAHNAQTDSQIKSIQESAKLSFNLMHSKNPLSREDALKRASDVFPDANKEYVSKLLDSMNKQKAAHDSVVRGESAPLIDFSKKPNKESGVEQISKIQNTPKV